MLETAEIVADRYGVSREAQDEYAVGSLSKALSAQDSGAFAHEITPVTVPTRGGDLWVEAEEQPGDHRAGESVTEKATALVLNLSTARARAGNRRGVVPGEAQEHLTFP